MKQLVFMIFATLCGTLGAFVYDPAVGVAVYFLFGVLRPQFLWQWALPPDIGWSGFVGWATIAATVWASLRSGADDETAPSDVEPEPSPFTKAHILYLAFGAWIAVTYVTAIDHEVAWPWFLDYLKIFLMFAIATKVVRTLDQTFNIYILATAALIYIAYEMNFNYFTAGRLDIYHYGYGGLDNNGAGLMLAMGIPLALNAWEGIRKIWRWAFLAGVPLLLHAVLMSYSRGAMLSLIVATPLLIGRTRKRLQFTGAFILLMACVPVLAGQEIRARFFTIEQYDTDGSANSRFESWQAAIKIANAHPVFGVGIRNSNLMSFAYGADMEGRTIHSQYLQTLADSGYVGLALYLIALGSAWLAMRRARRRLKNRPDDESKLAINMLNGAEGSLLVFCVGGAFLSLEVFELPYIIAFLGIQTAMLTRDRHDEARASEPAPVLSPLQSRA